MHTERNVYVVDGARTPFLKARGKPGAFAAVDLAVAAGQALLLRQPLDASELDEVILGCVAPGPDEANIGRIAALRVGCGDAVPAWTVQRNCGSGMQALDAARIAIASGRADLVLAGGAESMSHAPLLLGQAMVHWLAAFQKARGVGGKLAQLARLKLSYLAPVIGLLRGLTDPVVGLSMGQTAEELACRFTISRTDMDAFALRSHQRAAAAIDAGHLAEVVPVYGPDGERYSVDDGVREDSSLEKLAGLRPVFDKPYGLVSAGNSAQVTDGAAWCLLASAEAVERHGLTVIGELVDGHWAALDPAQMGLGPVFAATPLLSRQQLTLEAIDYWEINEAFAAQVLACLAAWQDADWCREQLGLDGALGALDEARLNVDGGAIALGHPVGASGARIVLHLLEVLKRNNATVGMAAICIGGGQGGAMLVRRADD